ncbi:hypothetical protein HELRODRAFT_189384 [Helobdella robusta]|uniref:C3H1-type domain-containing protein n=1 Tax=Helobdella robusta TaxID=6412 RepID=T1FR05_HELRO|nr:hypothetical protein HELRODRAFT_189384 [Helobdella robusta]ESN94369.1 hypothetical protein HELRODRAFT_189384 [Helobdella robusta]
MADSSLSSPAADDVDHISSLDEFPQNSSEKMLLEKNESLDNGESAADDDRVCSDDDNHDDNSSSDSGEVSEEDEENCDHLNDEKNDINDISSINRSFNEDEMDDRSETPLQDEPETENQNENSELKSEDKLDFNETVKKDDDDDNESTKESAMNDDHGELDYEEDVDDSIEKNKAEIKIEEQMSTSEVQKAVDDEMKGAEKQSNADDGSHSSDGELADDDDCEEGEIKEPGAKKPFSRALCRFFSRGSCTWGINCRFLHPGVNDKGNYTMLEQQHQYAQPPPPHLPGMLPLLRGPPPPPWMHEMASESEFAAVGGGEGMSALESAWERGLRHAKEIRSKRKETDGDDKKGTSTSPLASDKLIHPATSSHLAPPPHRDPYYEDLHQTLSTSLPGLPPMPLSIPPMLHHPVDPWLYRHPFEYEMRWPRPPAHPLDYMHPGFHPVHDFRMMDPGRGRRFSPPLRIEASQRLGGERVSRGERHHAAEGTTNSGEGRGKCEEWKDPWSRAKSPKNKRSSSSRSRSGKKSRSKRRYSSFSSSSYSSKSGSRSRSSSFSSYSSSRSSFSSRSRSSSKLSKSIPKKVVPVGSLDRSIKNSFCQFKVEKIKKKLFVLSIKIT